jgi:hypothetical protein
MSSRRLSERRATKRGQARSKACPRRRINEVNHFTCGSILNPIVQLGTEPKLRPEEVLCKRKFPFFLS